MVNLRLAQERYPDVQFHQTPSINSCLQGAVAAAPCQFPFLLAAYGMFLKHSLLLMFSLIPERFQNCDLYLTK